MQCHDQKPDPVPYLQGGGEMGELIRKFDWSATSIGMPDQWPQSLLATVGILLQSKFPMFLWWGQDLIQFYNDAYRPILGNNGKHPTALGQRGVDCWQEIWDVIKPLIDQVLLNGESTWSEDQLIPIYRNGKLEDVYWTFSYSAVIDETGKPGGVLMICTETTRQIQANLDLQKAKEELEFAIKAAELGTWDLDPATNRFIGNDRLKSWFGLPADAEIELSLAINVIAEQDRQRVVEAIQTALTYESGGKYDIEYTIINPQQAAPRFVRAVGKALFNSDKVAVRFSGTLQDITEEKNALLELIDINHRLEIALEQSSLSKIAAQLGTFDMDLVHNTLEWDDRCRVLFGISHHNPVTYEQDFLRGLHPDDRERVTEVIRKVMIKAENDGDYDVEYRTVGQEDKKVRWVRAKGKAYFDSNDRPVRFIGSVLDISDLKLDEARKSDFISMASHELKTPLTSLKLYLQILNEKLKDAEDRMILSSIEKAGKQADKMIALIKGFLSVSGLESGHVTLQKERFFLKDLVSETVDDALLISSDRLIDFSSCTDVEVYADKDKISAVVANLLSNAIKYSPPESRIEIACSSMQNNNARFSIKDEGIGITDQDAKRLFERFYRVENTSSLKIPGFGIGLYLSAEIIRRHGGKIWIESEFGKGSTFLFEIPIGG